METERKPLIAELLPHFNGNSRRLSVPCLHALSHRFTYNNMNIEAQRPCLYMCRQLTTCIVSGGTSVLAGSFVTLQ